MSHSKRNPSLPNFTTQERTHQTSDWHTPQRTRLTRDSFLPFASCRLCLQPARAPVVACASNGDLFCRECAISDLLAQRQEIKRLERERGEARRRIEEEEERGVEEVRAREVREFELVSMGLEGGRGKSGGGEGVRKRKIEEEGIAKSGDGVVRAGGGEGGGEIEKRRRISSADDSKERIRRELKREKSESSRPDLNSFWIPALTPDTDLTETIANRSVKLSPICPASTDSNKHNYSLKSLVDVHFTEEPAADGSISRVCPSCKKNLSNGLKAILTKPCGHIICSPCAMKFMTPSPDQTKPDPHAPKEEQERAAAMQGRMLCYVCETDITPDDVDVNGAAEGNEHGSGKKSKKKRDKERSGNGIRPGLVEVSSDGTGFAGRGGSIAIS